jgi:molybdate transport system substrate-binding protein
MDSTMKTTRGWARAAACWLAACAVAALFPQWLLAAEPAKKSVMVFAAASTGQAMDEIKADFVRKHGGEVLTSYAASSALAQQVVQGAEADVFISANTKWAEFLEEKGLVAQRSDLLGNQLVLVVPRDSTLSLSKLDDLLQTSIEHIAMGDPEGVPAGIYAKKALTKLGLWDRLKGKVATADNVQHALSFVETGAAQAGFVYSTDAAASPKVKVVLSVDAELTGPVVYPVLLLKRGADNPAAASLYRYLNSPEAIQVFRKAGFSILDKAPSQPH